MVWLGLNLTGKRVRPHKQKKLVFLLTKRDKLDTLNTDKRERN